MIVNIDLDSATLKVIQALADLEQRPRKNFIENFLISQMAIKEKELWDLFNNGKPYNIEHTNKLKSKK